MLVELIHNCCWGRKEKVTKGCGRELHLLECNTISNVCRLPWAAVIKHKEIEHLVHEPFWVMVTPRVPHDKILVGMVKCLHLLVYMCED